MLGRRETVGNSLGTACTIRVEWLVWNAGSRRSMPDDVADTILFLASDAARKISGQSISVDGHTEGLSNWLD